MRHSTGVSRFRAVKALADIRPTNRHQSAIARHLFSLFETYESYGDLFCRITRSTLRSYFLLQLRT